MGHHELTSRSTQRRNSFMNSIGILGAGLSGVLMGIRLRQAGLDDFTIYEKQPDVGGTWLRNTYPGLHCDVPSHLYCYSFEPNEWSMVFSGQAEIQAYLRDVAEKYDLIDNIRFGVDVAAAHYNEPAGTWTLELADGEEVKHRVLVQATGGLAEPRFPRIDGLETFEGPLWHSGSWRHDVDLAGKRVAVVGSAASAVQIVPAAAETAAEVFVFSRSPNWVMPRRNARYTAEQKLALQSHEEWMRLRRRQYRSTLLVYRAFKKQEAAIRKLRGIGLQNMQSAIDDPHLIEKLTPDFDPGCKRVLVSDDYYPALAQNHVHLIDQGVKALTKTEVVANDGSVTPVDTVIFCTGYGVGNRAGGRAALEVYGRDGQEMLRTLAEKPESYRGVAIPGYPNYFTMCGINGVVAYASLFQSAELDSDYITGWIQRLIDENLRSVEAEPDKTHTYSEGIQAELQEMSWAGNCTNFYKNAAGRILAFYPGTLGRMRRELSEQHEDDFILESF
jgi:cation diffusion facilitator CzcD-associated flavoprotein CzcO